MEKYETLDQVLEELDKKWKHSQESGLDAQWALERIPFKGLNFSIAVMWTPYRIEEIGGRFICNAATKESLLSNLKEYARLGKTCQDFLDNV